MKLLLLQVAEKLYGSNLRMIRKLSLTFTRKAPLKLVPLLLKPVTMLYI